ncbi:MAG: lanthionine synthetase LanC family protein [Rhodothermaceae bacterium]
MNKKNNRYLDTAIKMGKRLVESAIRENDTCSWMVNVPDREKSKERIAKKEMGGSTVYQGSSGMVLFLSALYKYDKDESYLKTAEGAVKLALKEAEGLPDFAFGLHSGRPGIAYAAARFAECCDKKEYFEEAKKVLAPLYGNEHKDAGIDVIGGAGGSIQILLKLSTLLNEPALVEMCEKLGDNLVRVARKELYGWCWLDESPTHAKCLCGYAHGAAGIGQAFIELYSFTGKSKYLYAADQAFRYEREHYSEHDNNWPDFRHSQIGEFYYAGQMDQLKKLAAIGKVEKYTPKFMNAWCHGAPGIALSRLRAFEVTGSEKYKEDAIEASKQTTISVQRFEGNYSLCHGLSGNSEPLVLATKILKDEKYLDLVNECMKFGIETFEEKNNPWPCGTLQGVNDPSFMLGEAGIGYFLLMLQDENLESVLLPVVDQKAEKLIDNFNEYRDPYLNEFFGETIAALEKCFLIERKEFLGSFDIDSEKPDLEIIKDKLEKLVNELASEYNFIKEIYHIEKTKSEMKYNIKDFTEEFLANLVRTPLESDFGNEHKFYLNSKNIMFETNFDIEEFLEAGKPEKVSSPKDTQCHYILYQQANRIFRKKLNDFAAVTFDYLKEPKNIDDVMKYFKDVFEIESSDQMLQVENALRDQILQAYFSGILVLEK